MTDDDPTNGDRPESIGDLLRAAAVWVDRHRNVIYAFAVWSMVEQACEETRLYAPADRGAWAQIAEARDDADDPGAMEALILDLYAPGGAGFAALAHELREAPLLAQNQRAIEEVLASLDEGRHYTVICGALPLVEGTLARAHGKWKKHPDQYPLQDRFDKPDALSPGDEADLLLNVSAIHMLEPALSEVWQSGPQRVGTVTAVLNRHLALHGTAQGWDTRENAVRAVLLLAAAARVAGPLLE